MFKMAKSVTIAIVSPEEFCNFFSLDQFYTTCWVSGYNPQANGLVFVGELSNLRIFMFFVVFTLTWTIQPQMWPNQVLKLIPILVYHVPMCMQTLNVSMHSPTWFWLFQALLVTLFPCKFEMPISTLVFYLHLLLFANLMTWNDSNLIFAHGNQIITQSDTIWSPKVTQATLAQSLMLGTSKSLS